MSTLYVVGTPEGDPADLTLRAVRILGQVSVVIAKDVERVQRLLAYHQIATPLRSTDVPLEILDGGDVALLVSGHFPGSTAPGQRLIQAAHQRGVSVVPVPGPSVPISALVISGLPADGFVYLGKLPTQSGERRSLLASVAAERRTLVIQENADLLPRTLPDLHNALGRRPLCIVTTSGTGTGNDAVFRGTLEEASPMPLEPPGDGPCVLVVGGYRQKKTRWSQEQIHAEVQARLEAGQPAKEIARALATESGWPRRQIYRMAVGGTE